jgi:hypothetical protein
MADHVVNGVIASAARRGLSMPLSYRSGAGVSGVVCIRESKGGSNMEATRMMAVAALIIGDIALRLPVSDRWRFGDVS